MRIVFIMALVMLTAGAGCAPMPADPKGTNDNTTTQPGPTGGVMPDNDDAETPNDNNSNDGTPPANDGGGSPTPDNGAVEPEAPCGGDLTGYWVEQGSSESRHVFVSHVGMTVLATFEEPAVCDHRDDTGGSSETERNFIGAVRDCQLTGTISLCRFGCRPGDGCQNGWIDGMFDAQVNATGTQLSIDWNSDIASGSFTMVKFPCPDEPLTPADLGLPDTWRRNDFVASNEDTAFADAQTEFVPRESGPLPQSVVVTAGVSQGEVTQVELRENADDIVEMDIWIRHPITGDVIVYSFTDSASPMVEVGDTLTGPDHPIGVFVETGRHARLELIGLTGDLSTFHSPDCY